MNNTTQATWVELLKARRSKMPLFTGLGFLIIPFVGGFFMIVLKDPETAQQMGMISAKAEMLAGTADWPTYFELLAQAIGIGGLVLFSLIGSWVFGREFVDRTVKDLLALPTGRSSIVAAKFVVIALWSTVLAGIVYVVGIGVGMAVDLPATTSEVVRQGSARIWLSAIMTMASITPIIFFASSGHGYLPPIGIAILAIVTSQIVAVAGWGEYYPWAIPALYSQGTEMGTISFVIVAATGITGIAATFLWWEWADHTR